LKPTLDPFNSINAQQPLKSYPKETFQSISSLGPVTQLYSSWSPLALENQEKNPRTTINSSYMTTPESTSAFFAALANSVPTAVSVLSSPDTQATSTLSRASWSLPSSTLLTTPDPLPGVQVRRSLQLTGIDLEERLPSFDSIVEASTTASNTSSTNSTSTKASNSFGSVSDVDAKAESVAADEIATSNHERFRAPGLDLLSEASVRESLNDELSTVSTRVRGFFKDKLVRLGQQPMGLFCTNNLQSVIENTCRDLDRIETHLP
jgi:hypothetical protein